MNDISSRPADPFNFPAPLAGVNAYRGDPLLVDLTATFARGPRETLDQLGRQVMLPEAQELARLANVHPPEIRTHGLRGERLDQIEHHPAWHAMMRRAWSGGLHSGLWDRDGEPDARDHAHRLRAARLYLTAQLEMGHLQPAITTSASIAALATNPKVQKDWAPKILSRKYDATPRVARDKASAMIGIGFAERQAGSDMRGLTSTATRAGEGLYRLAGHKFYLTHPMADAFVLMALTREGPSLFLSPRLQDDGSRNGLDIQRLKPMAGLKSSAVAEVEFDGMLAWVLGKPGDGQRLALDMLTLIRFDGAVTSAGLMRAAMAETVHYTRQRMVGGRSLATEPLMARVLADMALDCAGATALSMRLAEAFDKSRGERREAAYARVMTPVAKYWTAKVAPMLVAETMEAQGAAGYVEERPMARFHRDAPAAILFEGGGNQLALDLARLLPRGRDLFEDVFEVIAGELGGAGTKTLAVLRAGLQLAERDEGSARLLAEQLALAGAAAELYRLGAGKIADAFLETRLGGGWRSTYGMLDNRFDARFIVDLLYPPPA